MIRVRAALALCLSLPLCLGCVEKEKRLSQADKAQLEQLKLSAAPSPQHALDIRFENKVRLLGYDLSTPEVREGETFTITWYWAVEQPLGEDWKQFTHLADAKKVNRINLDAVRPMRRLYPVERWKKGEYLKDPQEVTLPDDWNSDAATFYLGFYNGPSRLAITAGPQDKENRAEAVTVKVLEGSAQRSQPEVPRLVARRISGPITLDGKLDEPDWQGAQSTAPFVQTMTGAEGSFVANARVLYDAEHLYVGYRVHDDYLKSTFEKHDEHLWEQDCVELMVDPDGDRRNYFEVQVSPAGVVFDTRYDSRRKPQPFGDVAWSSLANAAVSVQGKLNDDGEDEGYTVELAIPWRAFAAGATPAEPPKAGETWRMNFFVMDAREKGQRAVGWSPPLIGDFHTLERFGRVVFPHAAVP
jgi:hypothetical protein